MQRCTVCCGLMVIIRDVNESRSRRVSKKILRLEKKISQQDISRPEILSSYFYVTKSKAFTQATAIGW